MLTTKLGSLNGKGLEAFSTGPVLKSEGAILFSLMASTLTPWNTETMIGGQYLLAELPNSALDKT